MGNSPSNDPSPHEPSSLKNCGNETVVCDFISWASIEQLLCI